IASGAVCVTPGRLPANVIVAPNSPTARDQASTVPASSDGAISGSVTRRKTVSLLAPRLRAASSRRVFIERRPDSRVITKNGMATNDSATITPGVVNGSEKPTALYSGSPTRPRRPYASSSAMPPTTGGSTIGSVVKPRTRALPRNCTRASSQASGKPKTSASAVVASEAKRQPQCVQRRRARDHLGHRGPRRPDHEPGQRQDEEQRRDRGQARNEGVERLLPRSRHAYFPAGLKPKLCSTFCPAEPRT